MKPTPDRSIDPPAHDPYVNYDHCRNCGDLLCTDEHIYCRTCHYLGDRAKAVSGRRMDDQGLGWSERPDEP